MSATSSRESLTSDSHLELIQRALNGRGAFWDVLGVDHGGLEGTVPQQLLNVSDIGAAFEQMNGEAVAQAVGAVRPVAASISSGARVL